MIAVAGALCASSSQAQCASDLECKGGRVCAGGSCVNAPCSKDSDCAGAAICDRGSCTLRDRPPVVEAPAAPVAASPSAPGAAPTAAAARGRLKITSEWPGTILVDGSEEGR